MREAIEGAAAAGPRLALLLGSSGSGKSAFVGELQRTSAQSATTLSTRCYQQEELPFKALDEVAENLAKYLAKESDARLRGQSVSG